MYENTSICNNNCWSYGQHTPVPGYHSESDINNAWIKVR